MKWRLAVTAVGLLVALTAGCGDSSSTIETELAGEMSDRNLSFDHVQCAQRSGSVYDCTGRLHAPADPASYEMVAYQVTTGKDGEWNAIEKGR